MMEHNWTLVSMQDTIHDTFFTHKTLQSQTNIFPPFYNKCLPRDVLRWACKANTLFLWYLPLHYGFDKKDKGINMVRDMGKHLQWKNGEKGMAWGIKRIPASV